MYHIKKYKVFESNLDEMELDIEDIAISEISDRSKFSISIIESTKTPCVVISLGDVGDYDGFRLGEVKDFIIRLKDYLGDRCGKGGLVVVSESHRTYIDITEEEIDYVDKYYNMVDAPGLSNFSINIEDYIPKYKVFESYKEDIISDIIDIFLSECPNEDKFKIHVSTSRSMHVGEYTPIDKDYIMVIISLQNLNYDGEYNFNIEELKPFLIRLNGY